MNNNFNVKSKLLVLVLILMTTMTACNSVEKEELVSEEISQEMDENTGLKLESSMEIKYAENFKVDYLEGGYKLLEDASGRKTLIIPENKEIPKDLKEQINILEQPIANVGIYSTVDASWFRPIDELEKIETVTFDKESWRIPEIVEQLEKGVTTYVGRIKALDFELLQAIDTNVQIISKSYEDTLFDKFEELDFDYLSMGAHLEEDPRGRMEWIKFISTLFDKEEEADLYYENELARIDKVIEEVESSGKEKPNIAIVYYSSSKKLFNVNKPIGHQAKMIELAGGIPYPIDPEAEGRGSISMTNEEFYKSMEDVDIIIYDNITGHLVQNKSDLIQHAEFISDLKVIEEGRIIGLQRDYWQAGDKVADLIEGLHEFIETPHGEIKENRFYFLME